MKCETNSSQTNLSYGNYNANTQTYSSKVEETQTRRNKSTGMPKPTTLCSYIRDIDFSSLSDELQCLSLVKDLDLEPLNLYDNGKSTVDGVVSNEPLP